MGIRDGRVTWETVRRARVEGIQIGLCIGLILGIGALLLLAFWGSA